MGAVPPKSGADERDRAGPANSGAIETHQDATSDAEEHGRRQTSHGAESAPFHRMGVMVVLSFVAMFGLMYQMVDRFANVVPNLNQVYMAGLMAAAMVIIEVVVMWPMYPDRRFNVAVLAVSAAVLMGSWFMIRSQAGIADRQFLKSMIPHHSGAIFVSAGGAPGAEIKLCSTIQSSQQEEIELPGTEVARVQVQLVADAGSPWRHSCAEEETVSHIRNACLTVHFIGSLPAGPRVIAAAGSDCLS